MKDELNDQVDLLLSEGKDRFQIWKRLKDNENRFKLRNFLNSKALLKDKKAYRYLNIFLSLILLFVTTGKILGVVYGVKGIEALILLVVPVINMYVLKEILFFRRNGYLFLCVLSVLSFVSPENWQFPEFLFVLAMIAISAFLYLKMFPKDTLIPALADKKDG